MGVLENWKGMAVGVLAAGVALCSASANAALVFEIERVSDSEANISVSGDLEENVDVALAFLGASATTGDPGPDPLSGAMTIGGADVQFAYIRNGTEDFWLELVEAAIAGAGTSGALNVILDVEIWSAIGTTGDVVVADIGTFLGTYSIVGASEVPVPAAFILFATGFAALRMRRRKKGDV